VSESGWIDYVGRTTKGSIATVDSISRRVFANLGVAAPPPRAAMRYVVPDMPRTLPHINFGDGGRGMHEHDGVLWVRVNRSDPPRLKYWDQIDLTSGMRVGTVVLPENQHLLHVGALGAYVIDIDSDDLQRLLLYRKR
jgi:hypothetical protein